MKRNIPEPDNMDEDVIKRLNEILGMEHRSVPYNLTDADDLKQALTIAVGAYRDYRHYASVQYKLVEDFDESLEHYDTATWFHLGSGQGTADDLSLECYSALRDADNQLSALAQRAEEHLSLLMKVIVTADAETQRKVIGRAYSTAILNDIDEHLENLLISLDYAPYHHAIPDNFDAFLTVLAEEWPCD